MSNLRKEFSNIYDKHVSQIYRFIYLKVSSNDIAEDLTSEVFLRAFEAFRGKKRDIENVSAFLYQIARNLVVDHYRDKAQAQFVSTDYVILKDQRPGVEEKAALGSDLEVVKSAMAGLKDEYREILVLHYLDDLSVKEVAKIVDKSEDAVRVTIHRALQALKEQFSVKKEV
ncbi:MAG: RNA polymerase sigma factor [Candidatus Nealsonbacteria bacterium]|nr:RNA polymerase sigma factor [Candidatus Nealsonbacteria bacterium]